MKALLLSFCLPFLLPSLSLAQSSPAYGQVPVTEEKKEAPETEKEKISEPTQKEDVPAAQKSRTYALYISGNITSLDDTSQNSVDLDPDIGGAIGGAYRYELGPQLSFRTGMAIELLGATQELQSNVFPFRDIDVNFYFLQLNVPVSLQFDVTPHFGFIGGIGVNLNFSESCSVENDFNDEYDCIFTRDAETFFFTGSLGGIFHLNQHFSFEVLYHHGINDIAENLEANYLSANGVIYF